MNNANTDQRNKIAVGIDLGTTFSCVSWIDSNGIPQIIINGAAQRTTPSVVKIKDGRVVVGQAAKSSAIVEPERVISSIKREMGKKDKEIVIEGKKYLPEQISAMILSELVKQFYKVFPKETNKACCVITVPAYFNDEQKSATMRAAKIADIDVLRIINEPTAAALAYGSSFQGQGDQIFLVYDLGGGTFDVSLVEKKENLFNVLATAGDNSLGGNDFDELIFNKIFEDIKNKKEMIIPEEKSEDYKIIVQRIREAANEAKHTLSSSSFAEIKLPYLGRKKDGSGYNYSSSITRDEFEKWSINLLEKTKKEIERIFLKEKIANLGIKKETINRVILVGGSTRMPMVSEMLRKIFGEKRIDVSVNPDEVVAVGAAIQSSVIIGTTKNLVLLDITALGYGIETSDGAFNQLIKSGSNIPIANSAIFSTVSDNQTAVTIMIYQGERAKAIDNKFLGSFNLTGIEAAPRGIPQIEVTFSIDTNGLLKVTAKDLKTKTNNFLEIKRDGDLSAAEIEKMKKEAKEFEEADKKFLEEIKVINTARSYLYTFESQIKEAKEKIDSQNPQLQEFEKMYEDLSKALDERDINKLSNIIKEIDKMHNAANELMKQMPKNENNETDNNGEKNNEENNSDPIEVEPEE